MTQRINRRGLLGGSMGLIGGAGFGCLARASEQPAAASVSPPPATVAACGGVPLAQDYTVIYNNPDRELYVEGCGLVRLPDGTLVAAVPVVPRSTTAKRLARPSTTYIVRSTDGGRTWNGVANLPYYTAIPWVHGGVLYLFACKAGTVYRNDDLLLLGSRDAGQSWTEPVTLFQGHFWNCHTGMVKRKGKLYWALCEFYGSQGTQPRSPRAIAGDLTGDPLDPRAWRMSNRPEFPGIPASFARGQGRGDWLEQSVIEVQGRLRVLCRVRGRIENVCGVLDLQDDGGSLDLRFTQCNALPGGHVKCSVLYDDVSRMFWTPANLAGVRTAQGMGGDRRFLALLYSLDALNWFQAGCIARARKLRQSFNYAHCLVDGDDLLAISRTSVDGPNQHDADYATFHRVKDFRRLALELVPEEDA